MIKEMQMGKGGFGEKNPLKSIVFFVFFLEKKLGISHDELPEKKPWGLCQFFLRKVHGYISKIKLFSNYDYSFPGVNAKYLVTKNVRGI